MVKASIVNIVVTASLDQKLDFSELCLFKEINYSPFVYSGHVAYFKTTTMQGRISIFASGKLISVGTTSESRAFLELEILRKLLFKKRFIKKTKLLPKVQNIVVSADFGEIIDFEKILTRTKGIYEPEQFPGLILKMDEPYKASVLIFASGKVVITGLKSSEQIEPTIKHLKQLIKSNQ